MGYDRLQVGHLELLALLDADAELEGSITEMFPDAPAEELLAFRDRAPEVYGADHGGWQLKVRAWLIRHPGGVVLVDTGIGVAGAPGPEWMGTPGRLLEVLHETGTPPDSIDTVVITHVHDDHIGGTVAFPTDADGEPVPTPAFPRARHVIQRADWEWQHELARQSEEDATILRLLLEPLGAAGLVDLVEGDVDLAPGIQLHHAPGHTPGHQVVRLGSRGRRAIVTADAFNHPAQFSHPDWPSGPDAIYPQAAATRRALIAELFSHPGTPIAPTHLAEPFGEVRAGLGGLATWVPRD
jgi:glyoxylase-like metal-dependent hydrolase (beta-lactamase superfamily II)